MRAITRFTLGTHQGEYADWPGKTPLIVDGNVLSTHIPGYTLLHQFAVPAGYLLVTDYDCPFEEVTEFILLDNDFKIIDKRAVGAAYSSYALETITWTDDTQFTAHFYGIADEWRFHIRSGKLAPFTHRLDMKLVTGHVEHQAHNDLAPLQDTPSYSSPTAHARYFSVAVWIPGIVLPLLLLLDALHKTYFDLSWSDALVLYGVTYGTIAYWCFAAWACTLIPKKSTLHIRRLVNWAPCLFMPFYAAAWIVVGICYLLGGNRSGWGMMLFSLSFAPFVLGFGYFFTIIFIFVDSFIRKD